LVVVPTDALRAQLTAKFLTLGILKIPGGTLLKDSAQLPVVCSLEHIPRTTDEVDELIQRAQIIITTSSVAGQSTTDVQERFANQIPYLFIDEAHHVEAPTWRTFKEKFSERYVVQFTATPFREDDQPLDGNIVFRYPLKNAQEEGYYRPIHFESVLEFDPTRSDRAIADKAIARLREDYDKGHIVMARVDSIHRARAVFEIYQQYEEFHPVELHTGIGKRAREEARRNILAGNSRIVVCVDIPSIEATVRQAQAQFNRWMTLEDCERRPAHLLEML
jgi:superfamily II DNA or RNA helicase